VDFFNQLKLTAPMKIIKLFTSYGRQFNVRFTSKKREPSNKHGVDVRCNALNIEHRLHPPPHNQTNCMVERFHGRSREMVTQTWLIVSTDLEASINKWVKTYNLLIPQHALKHISTVQAHCNWHMKKPEFIRKHIYKSHPSNITRSQMNLTHHQ
jgi:Integrase core domain